MKRGFEGWLLAGMALHVVSAPATEVYRHVDRDGVVHYSDQPPSKGARPVDLPPIQVIAPPDRAAAAVAPVDGVAETPALSIVAPMPGQAFRDDDPRLDVSVRVDRPLPEGHGLLYLLDGAAQNAQPTRALNFRLQGLARGAHQIGVVTLDAAGREVARAAPVTIHVNPSGGSGPRRAH